jgi:hypothetical protein
MPPGNRVADEIRMAPGDTIRVYTASHRFFDNLVTFVGAFSGVGLATSMLKPDAPVRAVVPDLRISLAGKEHVSNCTFWIQALPILQELAANRWPTRIEIVERPGVRSSANDDVRFTNFPKLWGQRLIEPMFLQYFETNRPSALSAVWEFGRVVRNACAHNGRIDVRNPDAPPVGWKTLTYSPADNGREIWFRDFTAVEILLLMEEMDAALPS